MVTLKRPALAKYSLMFLSMDMACSSEGDWAELCFSSLNTGTVMKVRVTTSDARYQLLFFILNSCIGGAHSACLNKKRPKKPAVLLPDASSVFEPKQMFLLHLSVIERLPRSPWFG